MSKIKISRALISVYDKTGIIEFASELSKTGIEIISTGGTAKALRESGLTVTDVSDVTGFPEMMDGRVKTLHPKIHGGILGRLDNEEDICIMKLHGIVSIDIVIINLYPFQKTVLSGALHEEIIEQIDIGGPAMIRSSAKNYNFTAIVTNPHQYYEVLSELSSNNNTINNRLRLKLASDAFLLTSEYDNSISNYFSNYINYNKKNNFPDKLNLNYLIDQNLRYGENPHQGAALYGGFTKIFNQIHGKELSYNNIVDIDSVARLVLEFDNPTCAIVKHTNPCGVASAGNLKDAYKMAFDTDVLSPFGGIIAVNRKLDLEAALEMNTIFSEVIIAPEFDDDAINLLKKKKDRRLIIVDYKLLKSELVVEYKSVSGGMLVQNYDSDIFDKDSMKVVTKREPTPEEWESMMFAWKISKHVKSNAIVYAKNNRTLGIGAGQMSRVDSVITATRKSKVAGLDLNGSAVASEAFFPFADGLLEAINAGATAVIQPGGSVRDNEVIEAADLNNATMIMTGMRHFKH